MLRRLFFAVTFLIIITGIFAQTEADFTVTLTDDFAGVRITRYNGDATQVTIPKNIQGMPVKEIGDYSFVEKYRITSVTIPEGVTLIGYSAFADCFALHSVRIPESLTEIGGIAFWRCHALASIALPSAIQKIGIGAFSNCISLTTVTIPDTVKRIEFFGGKREADGQFHTFGNCSKLTLPSQAALRKRGYTESFQN